MNGNIITNIFGNIAGVPQIILGIAHLQSGDLAEGLGKIAEGVGILIVSYFVGKPTA